MAAMTNLNKDEKAFFRLLAQLRCMSELYSAFDETRLMRFLEVYKELRKKKLKPSSESGYFTLDWNHHVDFHGRLSDHTTELEALGFRFFNADFLEDGWQRGYFQWRKAWMK